MEPQKLVIDASVALKWQLEDEEDCDKALEIRNDYAEGRVWLIAPAHFIIEVVSGLNVAITRNRMTEEQALIFIKALIDLGVELIDLNILVEQGLKRARQYQCSPYDGVYLALADKESCQFYTGDKKLYNKLKDKHLQIKWIGSYS